MDWTTLSDLRKKVAARYDNGELLAESFKTSGRFPWHLALKAPTTSELTTNFAQAQDWTKNIMSAAKNAELEIEWREINHRQLGRNKIPVAIILPSLGDAIRWLNKSKEAQLFGKLATHLLEIFPVLEPWVLKNPHNLLQNKENIPRFIAIIKWVSANPRPGIYLRQITLPGIDTKFFEQHKKTLAEWLDLQLPAEGIDPEQRGLSRFEARFGFKEKPVQVRFRILDRALYLCGLSDLTLTSDEFCALNLPVKTIFITENDINGLAFPDYPNSIVIFGRGYGFDFLHHAQWLKDKKVYYWGDIDTHGFAILNQCRHALPQVQSMLMNEDTLLSHKEHWTCENRGSIAQLKLLTADELRLYQALQNNEFGSNVRLEQEFVNYAACIDSLSSLI